MILPKSFLFILVLILIGGSIWYLESRKRAIPRGDFKNAEIKISDESQRVREKEKKFPRAREIVSPSGFINTEAATTTRAAPISLKDFIGKKVVMVDFWTYSCINCQRTIPYINAWHEKYKDQGLVILGVHTPEFAFEKEIENVQEAVDRLGVKYPVVLDNDYATWNAYQNRYWPRKYLIDIDGFIVYDHIGEGAYGDTEKKIQELLRERMDVLGQKGLVSEETVAPETPSTDFSRIKSPETYFGSLRNRNFGGGVPGREGAHDGRDAGLIEKNKLYLLGEWNITPEFAENKKEGARILFRYDARDVFLVGRADHPVTLRIMRDNAFLRTITIQNEELYRIISGEEYGEHFLEIMIENQGLQAFAFTFG